MNKAALFLKSATGKVSVLTDDDQTNQSTLAESPRVPNRVISILRFLVFALLTAVLASVCYYTYQILRYESSVPLPAPATPPSPPSQRCLRECAWRVAKAGRVPSRSAEKGKFGVEFTGAVALVRTNPMAAVRPPIALAASCAGRISSVLAWWHSRLVDWRTLNQPWPVPPIGRS